MFPSVTEREVVSPIFALLINRRPAKAKSARAVRSEGRAGAMPALAGFGANQWYIFKPIPFIR